MNHPCINTKQVSMQIRNNTDQVQAISLLQSSPVDTFINAATTYDWDITDETYINRNLIGIQVKANGQSDYQLYTATLAAGNPQSVVDALNSIGVGTFYKDEQSGQILIKTDNDNYVYGELSIFAHVVFAGVKDFTANNAAVMNIAGIATNYDGAAIAFTFENLPSFITVLQNSSFGSAPAGPLTAYFILNVAPGGVTDNGSYSFGITASDGVTSVKQTFTLRVDATVYPKFVRPYSQTNTRSIAVGDDSQTWTYNEVAPFANSYNASILTYNAYFDWGESISGSSFRIFPNPVPDDIGQGIILICISRTVLSGDKYSDCILLFITVTP